MAFQMMGTAPSFDPRIAESLQLAQLIAQQRAGREQRAGALQEAMIQARGGMAREAMQQTGESARLGQTQGAEREAAQAKAWFTVVSMTKPEARGALFQKPQWQGGGAQLWAKYYGTPPESVRYSASPQEIEQMRAEAATQRGREASKAAGERAGWQPKTMQQELDIRTAGRTPARPAMWERPPEEQKEALDWERKRGAAGRAEPGPSPEEKERQERVAAEAKARAQAHEELAGKFPRETRNLPPDAARRRIESMPVFRETYLRYLRVLRGLETRGRAPRPEEPAMFTPPVPSTLPTPPATQPATASPMSEQDAIRLWDEENRRLGLQ